MSESPRFILASGSPRRRQLLADAGYKFEVLPPRPEAEDDAPRVDDPFTLVADLAFHKGEDVVRQLEPHANTWVLSADTVAECAGQVLGKPTDKADARRILTTLSGQKHKVLTGVCLWRAGASSPVAQLVAESTLEMALLEDAWLNKYLNSGAWQGKAGAFGYQDGLGFVTITAGSESNVVGLPMAEVRELLKQQAGILPAADQA